MAKNLKVVEALTPVKRQREDEAQDAQQEGQRATWAPDPAPRRVRASTLILALLLIVLPTALAGFYYGWMATDRYVSSAQVTVRSSGEVAGQSLDGMLGGLVSSGSGNKEAYIVQEYVKSAEIVEQLQGWLDLRQMWSAHSIDPVARLPEDASLHELHQYYQAMVTATYDSEKNVVTVEVQGYTPDDAQALATSIITLSESLVNRISDRIREDAVAFAKQEVSDAEDQLREARLDIKQFQNKHGDLDPQRSAEAIGGIIANLESQLAQVRTKIASQGTYMRDDSAAMESLYAEEQALKNQIERERERLTGQVPGSRENYADLLVEYERLKVQQEFARSGYEKAQTALETARLEASRKQLYLVDFVQPSLPDDPTRPERLRNILIAFVGGIIAFAIISLIAAAVREHARL
jgi:capsular polysaccharide transport system permease protein